MFRIKLGLNKLKSKLGTKPQLYEMASEVETTLEPEFDYELPTTAELAKAYDKDETVNITYPIKPPYQFANVMYDGKCGGIIYRVIEPALHDGEGEKLKKIKRFFSVDKDIDGLTPGQYIEKKVREIVDAYKIELDELQLDKIIYYLKRDFLGSGHIDPLMNDPFIEDISCNGPGLPIYIYHRVFESLPTTVRFEDVFELNRFVLKLAQVSGSHISVLDPITDATLPDGSRLNLTYGTEVTRKGSSFTIRKFTEEPVSPIELLDYGSVSTELLAYLWLLLEYGKSILVSGGTATGKTTLLNAILLFIKPEDKIVSVEDTAEINIPHDNWIQSVTRSGFGRASSANVSGVSGKVGDIGLYNLVMAALRQRPDYIIVGEVRGSEAFTMFQAISVGHAVMGTIHAGSMQELINRVESPPMNVPRVLLAGLDLVIFAGRILRSDGHIRRVTKAVEVLGFESDELITNDIFRWNAYEDEFEYEGSSYLLERISEEFGIEYKYLVNELEERSRLINEMQCDKITNFRDVSRCIRSYQSSIKNKR